MDVGEAIKTGGTRGGGRLLIALGGEWSDEKNKNREGDGASDFDGFFWMGGHNNQPKSSLNSLTAKSVLAGQKTIPP